MNYEEFKAVIEECIQEPDKLLSQAETIIEAFKTSADTSEALRTEIESLKEKNNDLRDTNVKLLLRQTFEVKPEPPEKTDAEIQMEILNKINGKVE